MAERKHRLGPRDRVVVDPRQLLERPRAEAGVPAVRASSWCGTSRRTRNRPDWFTVGDVVDPAHLLQTLGFGLQTGTGRDDSDACRTPHRAVGHADAGTDWISPASTKCTGAESGRARSPRVQPRHGRVGSLDARHAGVDRGASGKARERANAVATMRRLTPEDQERRQNFWWYLLIAGTGVARPRDGDLQPHERANRRHAHRARCIPVSAHLWHICDEHFGRRFLSGNGAKLKLFRRGHASGTVVRSRPFRAHRHHPRDPETLEAETGDARRRLRRRRRRARAADVGVRPRAAEVQPRIDHRLPRRRW